MTERDRERERKGEEKSMTKKHAGSAGDGIFLSGVLGIVALMPSQAVYVAEHPVTP